LSFALVLAPIALFLAVLLFLLPVMARLLRQCHLSDVTPEWLESFSPTTYQAMEILLAEEDFEFLVRQPGFEASLCKKLRRERIWIFRQYLNRLIGDFNRLHVYARYLITQSHIDQSNLLGRLVFAYVGGKPRVVSQAIARLDEMNGYLHALAAT
jgi:hypothetical protein